jgi:hypothetical protein
MSGKRLRVSSDEGSVSEEESKQEEEGGGDKAGNRIRKKRSKLKVKYFKREWMHQTIDGAKVTLWLQPDPKNKGNFLCTVCPGGVSRSCNEGWAAIRQHCRGKSHKENLEKSQTNPDFKQVELIFFLYCISYFSGQVCSTAFCQRRSGDDENSREEAESEQGRELNCPDTLLLCYDGSWGEVSKHLNLTLKSHLPGQWSSGGLPS